MSSANHSAAAAAAEVIDLTETDDENEASTQKSKRPLSEVTNYNNDANPPTKKCKKNHKKVAPASPEVEILDQAPNAFKQVEASALPKDVEGEDAIVLVGTKNHFTFPHMRQHCTEKPFQENQHGLVNTTNNQICDCCFCYVCDERSSECLLWSIHCHATDRGPTAKYWRGQREIVRTKKTSGTWNPQEESAAAQQAVTSAGLPLGKHFRYECRAYPLSPTGRESALDRRRIACP